MNRQSIALQNKFLVRKANRNKAKEKANGLSNQKPSSIVKLSKMWGKGGGGKGSELSIPNNESKQIIFIN